MLAGTSGGDLTARNKRAISVSFWPNTNNYFRRAVRLFNGEDGYPVLVAGRGARTDIAAAKGPPRMSPEARERMAKSVSEMRFDSEQWLSHFPVTLAGDAISVRRMVLAGEPSAGLPAMMANRELVRLLTLDPMFQLK